MLCQGVDAHSSRECFVPEKCFPRLKSVKLKFYPYQNPLFSLCEQVGGEPHFAREFLTKKKLRICLGEGNKVVDLPTLMNTYKRLNSLN